MFKFSVDNRTRDSSSKLILAKRGWKYWINIDAFWFTYIYIDGKIKCEFYIFISLFFHIYLTSYDEKDLQNVEENHETLDVMKNQDLCFN